MIRERNAAFVGCYGHRHASISCLHSPHRLTRHRPAAIISFASAHASGVFGIACKCWFGRKPSYGLIGLTVLIVSPLRHHRIAGVIMASTSPKTFRLNAIPSTFDTTADRLLASRFHLRSIPHHTNKPMHSEPQWLGCSDRPRLIDRFRSLNLSA